MDDPEISEGVALLMLPERRKAEGMFRPTDSYQQQ